jgi:hypothetical protein
MSRDRQAKTCMGFLVLILIILQGGMSPLFSQTTKRGASQNSDVPPCFVFDPKRVETLVGEVIKIDLNPHDANNDYIGLTMTTLRWDKIIKVSLLIGPKWFYEQQKFQIVVGDLIEVKGTRFDLAGTYYIPYEIKKGDMVMKIHDYHGPQVRPLYEQKPLP